MSILNIDEYATLQRAGFTRAQIATQQRKFYNLFRVHPFLTTEVERQRLLAEQHADMRDALKKMLACCYDMERNDETLAAVKSAIAALIKAGEPT